MTVSCYSIVARGAREAEIVIYEEIGENWAGEGITAKKFAEDVKALGRRDLINVRINSPGGSVFDAIAMHNVLARNPAKILVDIDGFALSAASVVAMAGQEIRMAENALLMIHNPHVGAYGDEHELAKTLEVLRGVKSQIVTTYANRTGIAAEDLATMMDEETWLDAKAAKERGFADVIAAPVKVANMFDLSRYRRIPIEAIRTAGYIERVRSNGGRVAA